MEPKDSGAAVQYPKKQVGLLVSPSELVKGGQLPSQEINLDNTAAHIKPGLEYPEEIAVQLTEGILGLGKHSAVTFKEISNFFDRNKNRHPEPIGISSP
ncbi:hypothetical protein GOBAR_AA28896 [Gossypium barbadense]|uniref:Uncharacterized protein n=1 Tax=Gossypium barbadense TaxID=3634 RepID=A0A2P5WL68_GOSBA|nr:hypothetical protein GOBAR_AA28896 [Gossypium barbadense]